MAQSRESDLTESTGHKVDTLRALVGREFRMRYKGSFFGVLWAVLSPLGTVLVLQLVFTRILTFSTPNFGVFLYSAMLPWAWFAASVQSSATTLLDHRDLVRTPFFHKPLLPAAVTCTNFLLYVFALPVMFGLMVADGIPFTGAMLALPAIWVVEGLLTLAFCLLIAALGILMRDIQHLIGVVLMFGFYLTPIFYELSQVPPELSSWFRFNPMAAIVSAHRDVLLHGRLPDWRELGVWALASLALLAICLNVFKRLEDAFIDEA
jgi:lipopolysaccharide transport system permease protein